MLCQPQKACPMYNLPELSLFKLWVEWDFFEKYFWTQKKFVKKGSGTITTTQRQPMCCCQPQKVCSVYNLPELSLFKLLVEWDFFSSPKVFLKPEKVCEKGKRDNKDGTATTHVLLPTSKSLFSVQFTWTFSFQTFSRMGFFLKSKSIFETRKSLWKREAGQ